MADWCTDNTVKYIQHMTHAATVLDRVLHLSALVSADMARFEKEQGLTGPRVHLLWVLGRSGPCTQQSLAQALDVTPRNITGLVDGLVASGHVTRQAHPDDRRATLVTPTATGRRTIEGLVAGHADLASRLFGDVPDDRLEVFAAVLDETAARFATLMEEDR